VWVWELMTFLSGFFSLLESAAQVLLVTITNTAFQIGLGLDQTACMLIGNEIGKGNFK
jgi:Na+-driven multidrug efflux pump